MFVAFVFVFFITYILVMIKRVSEMDDEFEDLTSKRGMNRKERETWRDL